MQRKEAKPQTSRQEAMQHSANTQPAAPDLLPTQLPANHLQHSSVSSSHLPLLLLLRPAELIRGQRRSYAMQHSAKHSTCCIP